MQLAQTGMRIGYARVSTIDQNLDLQLEALKLAKCDRIFEDKVSGKNSDRKGLGDALAQLRPGDVLIVWKLDRLGRNVVDLIELVLQLKELGVGFVSLTENFDTTSPMGEFVFHIMASFAQLNRSQIVERTMAGIAVARKHGRVGGRPVKLTPKKIESAKLLLDSGTKSYEEVAAMLNVSKSRLYAVIPIYKKAYYE